MKYVDKTGKEVKVGNWLIDTNGTFEVEVMDVDVGEEHLVHVREVFYENCDSDAYWLGDNFMLTRNEVKLMEIIS